MTKFSIKNLAIAIFLGVLLFGIIGIANAQETLPKGGDSFRSAVEIEAGDYILGHEIEKGVAEYFKISLKAGQLLKVKMTTSNDAENAGVQIINSEEKKVQEDSIWSKANTSKTVAWQTGETGMFYIIVEFKYGAIGEDVEYKISAEDCFDANSQTDAGNKLTKTMLIVPGEYTGYLSGSNGSDIKDYYRMVVKKGETFSFKIVPSEKAQPEIGIYNSDREEIKRAYAKNPGAIIKTSLTAEKSENLYLAVLCDSMCSDEPMSYTLYITTEEAKVVPAEEKVLPEESTEEPTAGITGEGAEKIEKIVKTGIMLVWLIPIIIGLVILIVIIIVIVILVHKKKKKI